ncbi:MAG: ester cyclase [Bacteriovoracaceae bacterium]|nr:ester cyclase [Bacteriovoracaceae bacterium]
MKIFFAIIILSFFNGSYADESKPKDLVLRAITEVFFQHKIEKIDQYFSKDYIQHQPGLQNGLGPFKKYLQLMFTAFPDYSGEIENIVVEGNMVSFHVVWTGTHKSEFMGVKATGKKNKRRTADVLKVSNGMITEPWGVVDQLEMLKDLGMVDVKK